MHRGALTVIFEDHHYTSMIHSGMLPVARSARGAGGSG